MIAMKSTDLRKNFSQTIDEVVNDKKPVLATRTRDSLFLIDSELLEQILEVYNFSAEMFKEDDGSTTISLNEIDIISNGKDENQAIENLINDMVEYASHYYNDFSNWYIGSRKKHVPYILILLNTPKEKIKEKIICQHGKN